MQILLARKCAKVKNIYNCVKENVKVKTKQCQCTRKINQGHSCCLYLRKAEKTFCWPKIENHKSSGLKSK